MKTAAHLLVLIAYPFLLSACAADSTPVGPSPLGVGTIADARAGADPASGDGRFGTHTSQLGAPTAVPFHLMREFVNPCTGLPDTLMITGTLWIHDAAEVVRLDLETVTASGFEGKDRRTIVEKEGKIFKGSMTGMMANASGDRIRSHFIVLIDLAAGTTRVLQQPGPVCIGA